MNIDRSEIFYAADMAIIRKDKMKKPSQETVAAWQVGNGPKYSPVGKTIDKVESGEYIFEEDLNDNLWAVKQNTVTDNLIDLPGLPTSLILDQIKIFWDKTDEFKHYGFLQKRGIMLYGPPGTGKSSIIALLKRQLVDMGGVVFGMGDGGYSQLVSGLRGFRSVEKHRPIMTIVEDIETHLEGSNGSNMAKQEPDALALYDGAFQIDNVVHIATTNKPEVIADRFIRRPGRFDIVIGLFGPSAETREAYLRGICKQELTEQQVREIVDATKGLSLAYMREVAVTYLVLGIPLADTISRLKHNSKQDFSRKEGFELGFTSKPNLK